MVFKTCPVKLVTTETVQFLKLHGHYKAGHLYRGGGIADQPGKYLTAMERIESAINLMTKT